MECYSNSLNNEDFKKVLGELDRLEKSLSSNSESTLDLKTMMLGIVNTAADIKEHKLLVGSIALLVSELSKEIPCDEESKKARILTIREIIRTTRRLYTITIVEYCRIKEDLLIKMLRVYNKM